MDILPVRIEIGDTTGVRWQGIEAVVATGASYTLMPRRILERLNVTAQDRFLFVLSPDPVRKTLIPVGGPLA
jgi:hypothetical protein